MSLDEASLVSDVRSRLFAPSPASDSLTIGAELEMIPLRALTHEPLPIESAHGPSLGRLIRRAAGPEWREEASESGAPCWNLPDGSRISFEPGGQIEFSSRPQSSCSELIASLQSTASDLRRAASVEGVELFWLGVDPYNDISRVPLLLSSDRYVAMTHYLESRGDSGPRMMRQTAALQINIEHGGDPLSRWKLLNSLAPYVVALFANSRRYAGRDTGHASYRAHFWRTLDATRTGLPYDELDAAARYEQFALDAGSIRAGGDSGKFRSFRSLIGDPAVTREDWLFHLSTLFPEVRPKEYFELRSADTIDPVHLAAPLVFVAGIIYDDESARDAFGLLGSPDERSLGSAGRAGLADPGIAARITRLIDIALGGASRLGRDYISSAHRAEAERWLRSRV